MKGPEGDKVLKKSKSKKFFPIMFHDPLINPELILKSFPKSKIIFVDRHPQELIEEWIKKYQVILQKSTKCNLSN